MMLCGFNVATEGLILSLRLSEINTEVYKIHITDRLSTICVDYI